MAGGVVLLAHVLAIWVLAVSLRTSWPERVGSDIAVMFIQSETQQALAQPPLPAFKEPELDTVPPPEFQVEPDLATNAIRGAASEAGMLAPRPDPAHFNIPPALPATFKGAVYSTPVILKAHVLADGSIADASILKSSGVAGLDEFALDYIKNHWRLLPASINGMPVEAWTAVGVEFK